MPRVPEYGGLQVMPTIAPGQPVRGIDPNISAQGARDVRNALDGANAMMRASSQIALDFANEANGLRVKEALNKLRAEEQRLTYDKNEGYTTILGGNALNRGDKGSLDQEYNQKLKNFGDKIRVALGNDAQRKLFDESASAVYTQFGSGIQRHLTKQYFAYGDAVRKDEAGTLAQAAILSDDPQVIADSVKGLEALAHEQAAQYGVPVDVEAFTGPVLRQVIGTKISSGYLGTAKRMMDTFAGYLSADDIVALKKSYQEESEQAQAVSQAQKAYEISKTKGMAAAAEYMRKLPYNTQTAAQARFNGMIAMDKQAQADTDRRGKANAFRMIEEGHHISSEMMQGMSTEAQDAVRQFEYDTMSGKKIVTDVPTYLRLMRGVRLGTVTEEDVLAEWNRIGSADRERLKAELLEVSQGGSSGGTVVSRAQEKVADAAEKYLKYDRKNPTIEDVKAVRDTAALLLSDYAKNNGGKVPEDLDTFALNVFQKGDGAFSSDRYYTNVREGTSSRFNLDAGSLEASRESLQQESPAWRDRDVDDLTLRTWVASDPTSGLYNRDLKVRQLVESVRLKLSAEQGYVIRTEEAEQFIRDCIESGESAEQIRGWAQAQIPSAKRLANIQRVYDSQSF